MYLVLVVPDCLSVCGSAEQFVGAHFLIILSFSVQLPWICCIFFFSLGNQHHPFSNCILSDPDEEQPELWEFHTPQVLSQLFPLAVGALFCLTRLFQEGSKQLKGPGKSSKLVFVLMQWFICCFLSIFHLLLLQSRKREAAASLGLAILTQSKL